MSVADAGLVLRNHALLRLRSDCMSLARALLDPEDCNDVSLLRTVGGECSAFTVAGRSFGSQSTFTQTSELTQRRFQQQHFHLFAIVQSSFRQKSLNLERLDAHIIYTFESRVSGVLMIYGYHKPEGCSKSTEEMRLSGGRRRGRGYRSQLGMYKKENSDALVEAGSWKLVP